MSAGGDFDAARSSAFRDKRYRYPIYSNAVTGQGLYGYSEYADHPANSITVTARGSIGVANFRDHDFTAIGRVIVLQPRTPLDGIFFAEFINSQIDFALESTGVPQLTAPQIAKYPVAVPPPSEQRAIARVLSDINGMLRSLDAVIAKKRDLKQGAMQQVLTGRRRLAGFSGTWCTKSIGEFAECTAGGTPNTNVPSYWGGTIRWMNSGELNLKQVDEVGGRITSEGLNSSSAKLLPASCVLIGLAGQGRTRGTVAMNTIPLCTNQSIAAVLPNPNFVPEYLYHNLDSRYDELRALSTGDGGRGGLNLTIIRSVEVPFPAVSEQSAIAKVLSDMDAALGVLESRRNKARTLKQGMMQELLTGRIRLI